MDRLAGAPELLDGSLDDARTLAGNLRDLRRVNRLLGGVALSRRALDVLVGGLADRGVAISLLDIGTGAGDIPVALIADWRHRRRRLEITAVDDRPEVLAAARALDPKLADTPRLTLGIADGRSLPYPDDAFDVAHASLLLHHLDPAEAVAALREMRRVSTRGVVINDLSRSRVAWVGAWVLAHVATRNRYTRHDAPLSVRRAYTAVEAEALLLSAGLRPVRRAMGPFRHRWAIAAVRL
jgi:2-polyprenyl-3-methyl-5-hydroxy-6-metoxy-1,4-benzoquinol methylase